MASFWFAVPKATVTLTSATCSIEESTPVAGVLTTISLPAALKETTCAARAAPAMMKSTLTIGPTKPRPEMVTVWPPSGLPRLGTTE